MVVVGIDLAGKPENPTGFCILWTKRDGSSEKTECKILYKDEEILEEIDKIKPECIAIDAPFYLPRNGPWRGSEQQLLKRGFRPLSPILPTMRLLTLRARQLIKILHKKGYKVIEVFPRATEKILGLSKEKGKNKDKYDALLCALTAKAYLKGNYEDLNGIIIPKK